MGFGDFFKKEVTLDLNKSQIEPRKDRLAEVDRTILNVQEEKAAAMKEFNGRLDELKEEQERLLKAIETGKETIELDVFERVNERRGEVETVRVDNNEVLKHLTRPLTGEERQMDITDITSRKGRKKNAEPTVEAE